MEKSISIRRLIRQTQCVREGQAEYGLAHRFCRADQFECDIDSSSSGCSTRYNGICDSNLVNVAPLQLGEKVHVLAWPSRALISIGRRPGPSYARMHSSAGLLS